MTDIFTRLETAIAKFEEADTEEKQPETFDELLEQLALDSINAGVGKKPYALYDALLASGIGLVETLTENDSDENAEDWLIDTVSTLIHAYQIWADDHQVEVADPYSLILEHVFHQDPNE